MEYIISWATSNPLAAAIIAFMLITFIVGVILGIQLVLCGQNYRNGEEGCQRRGEQSEEGGDEPCGGRTLKLASYRRSISA